MGFVAARQGNHGVGTITLVHELWGPGNNPNVLRKRVSDSAPPLSSPNTHSRTHKHVYASFHGVVHLVGKRLFGSNGKVGDVHTRRKATSLW